MSPDPGAAVREGWGRSRVEAIGPDARPSAHEEWMTGRVASSTPVSDWSPHGQRLQVRTQVPGPGADGGGTFTPGAVRAAHQRGRHTAPRLTAASRTWLRGTKGHSRRLCSPASPRPGATSPRGRVPLTAKQPCRAVGLPLENPAESGRNQPLNVFFLPCPQRCSQGESYFSKRLERKRPFFLAVWSQFPLLLALGLFSLPSLRSGSGAYACRPESLHVRLRSPPKAAVEQTCYTGTAGTAFTSSYVTSVLEGAGVT